MSASRISRRCASATALKTSDVVEERAMDTSYSYIGIYLQARGALPELVAAACQIGGLGGVAGQLDGLVVRRARPLAPAQPSEEVGAGRMVGVVPGQRVLETVDGRQCHLRAVELGDRDRPVE